MSRKDTEILKSVYFGHVKTAWIIAFLFLFGQAGAQPLTPELKPMRDYYYIGEKLKPGINCFVITDRKQMEKLFGKIDRPDTPDFSREFLLVMVMPDTRRDTKLSYRASFSKAGNFMEIYCKADHTKKTVTYTHNPIAAAVIPRYKGVSKVNFYEDKKEMRLLTSVPLPERL